MNDEIKMFIAGEEVVSQNEFTINEEMLSASSTILNNCYPKSWELTKDYISNFYYPKDYSRFVIGQGEYLYGNDEFVVLETSGKNQANYNEFILRRISFDNSTGIYSASDNDNASSLIMKMQQWSDTSTFIQGTQVQKTVSSVGRITLTGIIVENCNYIRIGNNGRSYEFAIIMPKPSDYVVGDKFTISFDIIDMTIGASKIKNIQLEKGEVATNYMPFGKNISYETNVEKEWNNFNVYGSTYQKTRSGINLLNVTASSTTINGITFTVNDDKSITVNGTNTGSVSWFRLGANFVLPAGTYTLSNGVDTSYNTALFLDDNHNFGYVHSTKTFTSSVTIAPYIRVNNNAVINNLTIYPMIVSGSYTSEEMPIYEQYGAMPSPNYPSELISVGYENLLNVDKSNIYSPTTETGFRAIMSVNNGVIVFNGSPTISGGTNMYFGSFQVKESGNYRLSTNMENAPTGSSTNMILQKSSDNSSWSTLFEFSSAGTLQSTVVELDKNLYYRLRFYGEVTTNFVNTIFKPLLVKGIKKYGFVPYSKYGVEIENINKNILDFDDFLKHSNSIYTKSDNVYSITNVAQGYSRQYVLNLRPNTTYTLSQVYQAQGSINLRLEILQDYRTLVAICHATNQDLIARTFTTNSTSIYTLRINYSSNIYPVIFNKPMLEINPNKTDFEEHKSNSQLYILDEPLRSVENISDKLYINFGYLCVERKIGKKIYNGSENWSVPWSNTRYVYQCIDVIEDSKRQSSASSNIICQSNYYPATHYDGGTGSIWNLRANDNYPYLIALGDAVPNSAGKVFVKNFDISNVNDFKNWLSTHNIEMNYILNEPKIEIIDAFKTTLPYSYNGINNISLDSGLDTSMEIYYYWKNYDVLFAGVVKNSGDISLNPRHPHYCSLQILDYKTFLSESNTLDFVIANKTISEAISMVVNAVSGYGFIVGNIDIDSANDIIGAYSTLNKSAYDVLQYLAEISGSRWRARVVDSLTMAIDFYDPDTLPQAEDIEYTQEYFEDNNIVDLTFNYGTRDYRNKQILLSDEVYANINYDETLISNGYSNTFTLQNNIGDVVSVVVDGAEKTIGTNNDKQMGVEADFYFTPGKNVIESNSVYSAGTMIHLTYQPLVKGRQIVYNNSEVDRISQQTQTEGVIARYETRNDVLSSDELEKIAKTYIEYKGKAEVILTLRTQNKDLYNIGEVVYFNAPISDLAQNYMVKSKKTEYVVINKIVNLFYIYELTSSFNNEKAINYFDNQRSKATGNIEEGESITRNVDIETQANIIWSEGSVSSATVTVTGDNVLNCALNSPFVE